MEFGTYKGAGFFMGVSAVLHILAFVFAGFTPDAMIMAIIGVVYFFLAWGLYGSKRWLAYIVFLVALVGIILAMGSIGSTTIPTFWLVFIIAADFMVALNLFVQLWKNKDTRRFV